LSTESADKSMRYFSMPSRMAYMCWSEWTATRRRDRRTAEVAVRPTPDCYRGRLRRSPVRAHDRCCRPTADSYRRWLRRSPTRVTPGGTGHFQSFG
jgi:hypothetical protein